VEWLVPALVALALLLGRPVAYWLGAGAVAIFALGVAVYWSRIRPLRQNWLTEANRVKEGRKEGRPKITAPAGVTEWPLSERERRHVRVTTDGTELDTQDLEALDEAPAPDFDAAEPIQTTAMDEALEAADGNQDELAPLDAPGVGEV
jgi:hypothetical protein